MLLRKIRRYRPSIVATVGIAVFRAARLWWGSIECSLQPKPIGDAAIFVFPNPSGRNANYSYAQMLEAFVSLPARSGGNANTVVSGRGDPASAVAVRPRRR